MLINVPALTMLYSRYDRMVGHYQRYQKGSLRELFKIHAPVLQVVEMRYWGLSLIPVAWLRRAILSIIPAHNVVRTGFRPPTGWINRLFQIPMVLETACLPRPPWGTSLMLLARKSITKES